MKSPKKESGKSMPAKSTKNTMADQSKVDKAPLVPKKGPLAWKK